MRKLLSSHWTVFYRKIFPVVWIVGFGLGTVGPWVDSFSNPEPVLDGMKWQFLFLWIFGSGFLIWFARRLKVVWLEGDYLVVADYSSEFTVPFSDIESISETRFWSPKMINVHLKRTINEIDKVVFLAPMAFQLPFTDHPKVKELKQVLERTRSSDLGLAQ